MKRLSIQKMKKEEGIGSVKKTLSAVAPEYRFELYMKILAERRLARPKKGSPMLPGSFENGKRK